MKKEIKTSCHACHGGCGAIVTVEDGIATAIRPDPDSPLSKGRMCPKGLAGLELLYHPDRLNYPMKRVGERGEGKWERISWDEAYDIMVEKIQAAEAKDGMQSVAVAQGTGRRHHFFVDRFVNCLGTPNWFEPGSAQCFFPRFLVNMMMYGYVPMVDYYSDVTPGCIIVWGHNPTVSGADCECQFLFGDAVRRGSKVIVVDPRRNNVAEKADIHLQLRPGTDDALALAFLNVMISEELYDKEFVKDWCMGFEQLAERVKDCTPEWAEKITWVPADKIREAARLFTAAGSGALEWGCAIEHTPNAIQTVRAIASIPVLAGYLDKKGGPYEGMGILPNPDSMFDRLSMEMREARLGESEFRLLAGRQSGAASAHIPTVMKAMRTGKPYPINVLMLCGNNGLTAFAQTDYAYESLKNVPFICAMDMFMTPTISLLADLVLPVCSWLECDAVYGVPMCADWAALCHQAAVKPMYERRADETIYFELLERLGKDFGAKDLEEIMEDQLRVLRANYPQFADLTMDKMRELGHVSVPIEYEKYKKRGRFNTPSGKVELYCTGLEELGYDPLPSYQEPPESPISQPELAKEFPLVLTTGERVHAYFISENRQIPSLRKLTPYPTASIHPDTAARYGIADGDWMYIESPRGEITMKAWVTDTQLPGVVNCPMGWWLPERKDLADFGAFKVGANVLTSMQPPYDPAMGTYQLRGLLCRVRKNNDVTDADFDPGASVEKFPLPQP